MAASPLARFVARPSVIPTKVNPKDGLEYVWISPGSFLLGCSPGDEACFPDETPAQLIEITKGFWITNTQSRKRHISACLAKTRASSKVYNGQWRT